MEFREKSDLAAALDLNGAEYMELELRVDVSGGFLLCCMFNFVGCVIQKL